MRMKQLFHPGNRNLSFTCHGYVAPDIMSKVSDLQHKVYMGVYSRITKITCERLEISYGYRWNWGMNNPVK